MLLYEKCQNDKPQLKINSSVAKEGGESFGLVSNGVGSVKEALRAGSCSHPQGLDGACVLLVKVSMAQASGAVM